MCLIEMGAGWSMAGNDILEKDTEGWYHTVITEIRSVKEKYCCYKIKGKLDRPLDNGQADGEWIFFWVGMYDDLQVGEGYARFG